MYFDDAVIKTCPRKQMLQDLNMEIIQWIGEGNQIILEIDLNENVVDSVGAT